VKGQNATIIDIPEYLNVKLGQTANPLRQLFAWSLRFAKLRPNLIKSSERSIIKDPDNATFSQDG
jgi:hypothetical protein